MAKIFIIATQETVAWGGSEDLWGQTAERLITQGHAVGASVKQWPTPAKPVQRLEQMGCKIEYRTATRARRLASKAWPASQFACLDRFKPDLVVISQAGCYDGIKWAHECARRGLCFVLIAQSAYEYFWPEDEQAYYLARGFEAAAAAFFVSEANRGLIEKQLGTDLAHARIIRNPFNVSYDAAPKWPVDASPIRLACVARLDPKQKGQDILLEVLSDAKWKSRPLQLTFFGNGPNKGVLGRLAKGYHLENVSFGYAQNIEALWDEFHALVLPSRFEGLPLALVEAMLCGRPCIVTDVAGNAEVVEDNVNGFIAAAPTANHLDEALERAWQRRAEWPQIGRLAAQQVREKVPRDPIGVFCEGLLPLLPGS